jgi:hypothetical protein
VFTRFGIEAADQKNADKLRRNYSSAVLFAAELRVMLRRRTILRWLTLASPSFLKNLGFQIPHSKFQIPNSRFQISDFRFQITDYRFQITDFRIPIWNLEFGIWNRKTPSVRRYFYRVLPFSVNNIRVNKQEKFA